MHKNHFQQNDGDKKFKLKKDRFTDFYSSICGLTREELNKIGYTKLAGEKSSIVTYFDKKEKKSPNRFSLPNIRVLEKATPLSENLLSKEEI
mmetsp:Transcript_13458/g.16444  ORF Transcript_13458/g.16444 Transcript_13458/m.16444 type:complete len:92 (+) Transcript_13458:2-277(+)